MMPNPGPQKRKTITEVETLACKMYDHINFYISVNMKDKRKCVRIFHRKQTIAENDSMILDELHLFANITAKEEKFAFQNKGILIGQTEQSVGSYP